MIGLYAVRGTRLPAVPSVLSNRNVSNRALRTAHRSVQ